MSQDQEFDQEVVDTSKPSMVPGQDYEVVAKFKSHELALWFCRQREDYQLKS